MGLAVTYFCLGILFVYLAYVYADETVWNPITMLYLAIAAIDFGFSIQVVHNYFRQRKNGSNNKDN